MRLSRYRGTRASLATRRRIALNKRTSNSEINSSSSLLNKNNTTSKTSTSTNSKNTTNKITNELIETRSKKLTESADKVLNFQQNYKGEASKKRASYEDEIKQFVTDFNSLYMTFKNDSSYTAQRNLNKLKSNVALNQSKLAKLGITQTTNGALSLNERTLKNAAEKDLDNVFGTSYGFAAKVKANSKAFEASVAATIAADKAQASTNYDSKGTTTDNTAGKTGTSLNLGA